MALVEGRHEDCASGCVFPIIDFDSGTDATYVCGQPKHPTEVCARSLTPEQIQERTRAASERLAVAEATSAVLHEQVAVLERQQEDLRRDGRREGG